MKTIVIHAPKDLRIETRDVEEPAAGQVQIKLATGGICGSDLHYYNHGGFGTVRLKEPMRSSAMKWQAISPSWALE